MGTRLEGSPPEADEPAAEGGGRRKGLYTPLGRTKNRQTRIDTSWRFSLKLGLILSEIKGVLGDT